MGLSDDQRAMLRLLAQREQGYEDIAALMGISVEEVRARVADALGQLEREGKEPPDVPPSPQSRSEFVPTPEAQPPAPEPAPAAAAPPPPPSASGSQRRKRKLPADPAVLAAIAAGVLVLALGAIFLIVNSTGSDSESGGSTSATTKTEASSPEADEGQGSSRQAASKRLTKAVLEPVDGSDAAGVAIFGRVGKKLALQVEAEGLEPTTKGTSYTIWLAQSPQRMLPLAETTVPKSGKIAARYEVPVELIVYLASETFDQLVITRTDEAKLHASLETATQEKKSPTYTGDAVLTGTVTGPIVGLAKRAKGE